MAFEWTCPFCDRDATITEHSISEGTTYLTLENKEGNRAAATSFIVCPNPKCKKFTLSVFIFEAEYDRTYQRWQEAKLIQKWDLIPSSKAKTLPDYIPQPIKEDYSEAHQILALSPKASATLARRCLQGMIRNFFGISLPTLKAEIDAIQNKVDPLVWQAIEGVRKIGNIGAHMEKDINVIVDVEPNEAELLVGLIEFLIKDWYVARNNKEQHLIALIGVADKKDGAKKALAPTKK
jgi:Domain of unknown function (DUF4145)